MCGVSSTARPHENSNELQARRPEIMSPVGSQKVQLDTNRSLFSVACDRPNLLVLPFSLGRIAL